MLRVLVTVPNGDGWIHKRVAQVLLRLLQDDRMAVSIQLPTWSPYVHNLHRCLIDARAQGFDYWLSLDDDNPPTRNPLDLVLLAAERGLDLVGLPTPVWHNHGTGRPFYRNAMLLAEDGDGDELVPAEDVPGFDPEGLREVDAVGSGCFLMSKRLMEAFVGTAPFLRGWSAEGLQELGGDFSMCKRARAKGFRIWTHYGYHCEHHVELELGEMVGAMGRSLRVTGSGETGEHEPAGD